jgi:transcription antitermination factor NusB
MAARTKARKRALDVLFEADARSVATLDVLAARAAAADPALNPYTSVIVEGVVAHRERIDELLSTYAEGWSLERMPAVDRAVLRIGVWELLWSDEVPDAVAISEAVGLARDLSTDASPTFVNGLLARIEALKPTMVL